MRTTIKKLILTSLLLVTALLVAVSAPAASLYFPHVDTSLPWQTEIGIINTGSQTINGSLTGMSEEGQHIQTKPVALYAGGRRQIIVADEFVNHTAIRYIIYHTPSDTVEGYTKFYQAGIYRVAIPAVKDVTASDLYIPHIDSSALWWTGVSLVNTTSVRKDLIISFNTGQSWPYTLNAHEHKAFTIGSLLNQPILPNIRSAVISNASGVIGLALFGSNGSAKQLDGLLLSGKTASSIYYPHVAGDGWWTGVVAYNHWEVPCSITITPYNAQGSPLAISTLTIEARGKFVGLVSDLGLPAQTAWFKIDSTRSLTGFELFGTADGKQLAVYAGGGGFGAKTGVFAKIEKSGWTGIAFVNTEASEASVTLTAFNDWGTVVANQVLSVGSHAKVVNLAEAIFSQNISSATHIAYSANRNVVGFQLNGASGGTMLDGLPALGEVIQDITPPTVPTGLTATAVSESRIDLSWTASTDNVGVTGYNIYRGNFIGLPPIKNVTGTSTSITGLDPSTRYCYEVRAYDAASNLSFNTASRCATTLGAGGGLCTPGQTLCAAGEVEKIKTCNSTGTAWVTSSCPDWTACADKACRTICNITSSPVHPGVCLFPVNDGVNTGEFYTWYDPLLTNNVYGRSTSSSGGTQPIYSSGSTWPYMWSIDSQSTVGMLFKLNQFAGVMHPRLTYRAKKAGVINNLTNYSVGISNGSINIGSCVGPPVSSLWEMQSCRVGTQDLAANLNYSGGWNFMSLSVTGDGFGNPPDLLDVNHIYLSIE